MVARIGSRGKSRAGRGGAHRLFRAIAEAYNGFAVLVNADGEISFVNSAILKSFSLQTRKLIGRPLGELVRRPDGKPFLATALRPVKNATVRQRNFVLIGRGGIPTQCAGKVYFFRDDNRTRDEILILGATADRRGFAVDDPTAGGLDLMTFADSIPDGVCILDARGKILTANSSLSVLLGRERRALAGATLPYPWHSREEGAGIVDVLREVRKKGPVVNRHIRGRGPGDVPVVLSYSIAPLRRETPAQKILFIATVRNVTSETSAHASGMFEKRIERLKQQVRRNAIRLETLQEINMGVLRSASLPDIFKRITGGIGKLVDHDLAGIYVFDRKEKILRPHTLSKQTTFSRKLAKFPLPFGEGIIGSAAISGETVLVNDAQHDPRSKYPPGMKPPVEHIIAAPLRGRTSTYGILVVARNRQPRFHEEDALVVKSFADAANVALENARLYQEIGGPQARPKAVRGPADLPTQAKKNQRSGPGRPVSDLRPRNLPIPGPARANGERGAENDPGDTMA